MKIVHVVSSISQESSGPAQSVPALCRAQARRGLDVELLYVDMGGRPDVEGVRTRPLRETRIPGLRYAVWNARMLAALLASAGPDVLIHAHSLWQFPTIYPGWVHLLRGVPFVMSPRGTLAPFLLQRSKKKKAISLALGQRYALEHASFIHVTSEAEAAEVRAYGLRNEIVLAPNGFECGAALDVARVPGRIVFLSRLHPKKGIDRLLDAWKLLSARVPHAELIIAGPSEGGHGEEMQARARDLGLARVSFPGEKLGMEKRRLLASASAFVLPSHNENFGMVVVEALAEGTPVVASFGTPWATLDEAGVGRWVPNDPEPMAAAMVAMLELRGEARAEVERRARAFARDRFDAARAAEPLIEAYARVLADRSRRTRDRASREGSVAGH